MSLLQATNISPSVSGAGDRGSAVVDLTEGLTISWQVNGSSPMTAYQVQIFKNDVESTSMYSTGKVTLETPFYGRNGLGEPQFFSFTIPAATVESAQLTNGNEYKYLLTQWWGDTDAESITQSSADVFIARSKPVLTLEPIGIGDKVTGRSYTFTASYSQAEGDGIESVRWNIFTGFPLVDSGWIYTSVLSWTYDGFLPTENILPTYHIRCTVLTQLGVEVTVSSVFTVDYKSESTVGLVSACCVPDYPGAVRVEWPPFKAIDGVATGSNYEIQDGELVISRANTSVAWNFGSFGNAWTVFWSGRLDAVAAFSDFLRLGSNLFRYFSNINSVIVSSGIGNTERVQLPVSTNNPPDGLRPFLALAITPKSVTWYYKYIPQLGTEYVTATGTVEIPFTLASFDTATLAGLQRCWFLYVKKETMTSEAIIDLFHEWFVPQLDIPEAEKPWPVFDSQTVMLADFQDELQAGAIHTALGTVKEYTVYREDGGTLAYEATIPGRNAEEYFYDYSIPQGAQKKWYVFATGTNGETAGPMTSETFAPFFWDWIVIRAAQQTDGTYRANQVFRFGKNLSSGQIGNNNNPEVLENFTPYPTVLPAPQNYRSGTLSSLIGAIDENGVYSDTIALRNAIYDLSLTTDTLFLKNRKGDLMQIVISGPVMMETNDASASQAQKVSLPWAEVGSAEGVSIIALNTPL